MGRFPGCRGVYAVDWQQTEIDEEPGLAPAMVTVGMEFRWRGGARRLDAGPEALWLDRPIERNDRRSQARVRARRLALADTAPRPDTEHQNAPIDEIPDDSFTLTDGHRLFHARLVRDIAPLGRRVLAVFDPILPPPDRQLWVSAVRFAERPTRRRAGVICFLPGTLIDTAEGPRPVEEIGRDTRVMTRDNGPQPVVWSGATQLTGAELFLHPHLRPVRLAAGSLGKGLPATDLVVSPGHRVLMPDAEALYGEPEVLAGAADLEDGRSIRRDFALTSVTYVHLMFEQHEVITANGQPCESFHPGFADPEVLKWHARTLERAVPGLVKDPARFGAPVRRCLSTAETCLLRHARG